MLVENLPKNQKYFYDIEIKKAKLNKAALNYIDPGEDYLPYALENKHIGSSFDKFLKEFNIKFKRDMNWAIKMLQQGVIVYREEFPEVILFPIGYKNNPETKLTVDDLFAEDWTIFRGKSLKEVLDDLDAGKTIRRKSWYPEYGIGKYSKDMVMRELPFGINVTQEQEKIEVEEMRNALVSSLQASAQAIPQLIASGGDPTTIVKQIAEVITLRQSGKSIEDAINEVFAPEELPAAGAPTVEQPSPAPAAPAAGAPQAPASLQSLFSSLSASGRASGGARTVTRQ